MPDGRLLSAMLLTRDGHDEDTIKYCVVVKPVGTREKVGRNSANETREFARAGAMSRSKFLFELRSTAN